MKEKTQTLRPTKVKNVVNLLISAAFVSLGVWLGLRGSTVGWFCAAFFGIGIVVFVLNLLPNSSFLALNNQGFTVRALYREHSYRWTDVEAFRVGIIGTLGWKRTRMVVFNFSSEYHATPRLRKIALAVAGSEGALPDTYGLTLDQLADKMNTAREAALQDAG